MNTKINNSELKKTVKENIKDIFNIQKQVSYIWIVAIDDLEKRNFILKWLSEIGIGVITVQEFDWEILNVAKSDKIHSNMLPWFDFFVFDEICEDIDVMKFMNHGIVPIMPEKNAYAWILKQFNPMKFEWNWFFYKKDWCYNIFERIVAYLENIKFPEDKRVLQKNVIETFN